VTDNLFDKQPDRTFKLGPEPHQIEPWFPAVPDNEVHITWGKEQLTLIGIKTPRDLKKALEAAADILGRRNGGGM
jgi:hypothetical protein